MQMLTALFGWLLIMASLALSAMLVFQLRSGGERAGTCDTGKARFEDIDALLERGKINGAEAEAERLAVLSRLWTSSRALRRDLRGSARTLLAPVVVFLIVSSLGAATSYLGAHQETAMPDETDHGLLADLENYTRTIGAKEPASEANAGEPLPDVNIMIERLATRLASAPEDVQGWRMLGWSYFNTERYEQAADAYARASVLDPNSAEIKSAYEEAKSKAAERALKQ